MPLLQAADAYTINGVSLEGMSLIPHFSLSAFGGTIYDDYSNSVGEGYNAGGSLDMEYDKADVGVGCTAEDHYGVFRRSAFFFARSLPCASSASRKGTRF